MRVKVTMRREPAQQPSAAIVQTRLPPRGKERVFLAALRIEPHPFGRSRGCAQASLEITRKERRVPASFHRVPQPDNAAVDTASDPCGVPKLTSCLQIDDFSARSEPSHPQLSADEVRPAQAAHGGALPRTHQPTKRSAFQSSPGLQRRARHSHCSPTTSGLSARRGLHAPPRGRAAPRTVTPGGG